MIPIRSYIQSSSISLIGKIVVVLGTLGNLFFLNAILGRDEFGLFMMGFSLITVLSLIISVGGQSLLLYHVARKPKDKDGVAGQVLWIVLALSSAMALLLFLLSGPIAALFQKPELANWLSALSLFMPAQAMLIALPSYWRAIQKVSFSILAQDITPNLIRISGLALIWLGFAGTEWIAPIFVISAALPCLALFIKKPLWPNWGAIEITAWDIGYAGKITLTQLLNQPFRGFDVVLVGALASAGATADYALCTRIVSLFLIPKQMLSALQVPRMGTFLEKKDTGGLIREYRTLQNLSTALVILGAILTIFIGGWGLSLFGEYTHALPLLFVLVCGSLIRTASGASGDLMSMAGHAGWAMIFGTLSSLIIVGGCFALIPALGAHGAALSVVIGTAALYGGYFAVLKAQDALNTWSWPAGLSGIATIGLLMRLAFAA